MGNMQYFYMLTQLGKNSLLTNVSNFIALAPCIYKDLDAGNEPVPFLKGIGRYRNFGIYAVNGPNWD